MSFPRYPKYKDSGVEWLGEIALHWETKQVRHLLTDGNHGMKIGPFGSQLTPSALDDFGDYKVYGQENVIASDFHRGSRFISKAKFGELSVYEIRPGDLLVTMMGTSGRCAKAPEELSPGIMDSHLLRLRTRAIVLPEFLRLLIDEAAYVETQVKLLGKGSIMHGLNSGIVRELVVVLPPIQEQRTLLKFIGGETGKIDALVEEQQLLIELLKEKRQAVISHAVTKGLNPNVPMKDSGIEWLGKIPAHWTHLKLKFLARKITDGAHVSPEIEGGEFYFVSRFDGSHHEGDRFVIALDCLDRLVFHDGVKLADPFRFAAFCHGDGGVEFSFNCFSESARFLFRSSPGIARLAGFESRLDGRFFIANGEARLVVIHGLPPIAHSRYRQTAFRSRHEWHSRRCDAANA